MGFGTFNKVEIGYEYAFLVLSADGALLLSPPPPSPRGFFSRSSFSRLSFSRHPEVPPILAYLLYAVELSAIIKADKIKSFFTLRK